MISYAYFNIKPNIQYQELKNPLSFPEDTLGLSHWILRFPLTIYSLDLKQKHVFNNQGLTISEHHKQLPQQKLTYFVVTQSSGNRIYCTSQTYYEIGGVSRCICLNTNVGVGPNRVMVNDQFYLPRCIVTMSPQPYFKLHVNLLKIHHQLRQTESTILLPFNDFFLQQMDLIKIDQSKEQTVAPLHLAFEFYVSKSNEEIRQQTILFEQYSQEPILHLYPLTQQLLQFNHFSNIPLSSQVLLLTLSALLLEKQLIFTSKYQNLTTIVIESIIYFIRPFKWSFMLVPNLPVQLFEVANLSFMPFIVGVSKKHISLLSLEEKCVVDIDCNTFTNYGEQTVVIPERFHDFLSFTCNANSQEYEQSMLQKSLLFTSLLAQQGLSPSNTFMTQFIKTMMFQAFKDDNNAMNQMKQFLQLNEQTRVNFIRAKVANIYEQSVNPKIVNHQIAWLQYCNDKFYPCFASKPKRTNLKSIRANITKNNIKDSESQSTNVTMSESRISDRLNRNDILLKNFKKDSSRVVSMKKLKLSLTKNRDSKQKSPVGRFLRPKFHKD